jgi:hypothetical protein
MIAGDREHLKLNFASKVDLAGNEFRVGHKPKYFPVTLDVTFEAKPSTVCSHQSAIGNVLALKLLITLSASSYAWF